jgi:hypothetical protein
VPQVLNDSVFEIRVEHPLLNRDPAAVDWAAVVDTGFASKEWRFHAASFKLQSRAGL